MSTYQVVEKFVSINGEGRRAGELAAFIRFKGCNLQCSYCDTSWANEPGGESERLTKEEILSWIRETGVKNVTLTGGEPLLREGMEELIEAILEDPSQRVEIETNGSVDLKPGCLRLHVWGRACSVYSDTGSSAQCAEVAGNG